MSNEGELKKRIKEHSWIDGEFRVANYDSFRVVLDEAKKEFPVAGDDVPSYAIPTEVKDWFKKWFGE